MEMMYLILKLGYASVVIPQVYHKSQCEEIVKNFSNYNREGYCIPAPKLESDTCYKSVDIGYGMLKTIAIPCVATSK